MYLENYCPGSSTAKWPSVEKYWPGSSSAVHVPGKVLAGVIKCKVRQYGHLSITAKHNAAFELLSSRLNNLHVSSADTNNTSRSRSSSPRRVRFDTPERPPLSPGYNYRRSDKDRPPRRYYDNANRNNCNYCGMIHRGNRCPAADAQCLYCGRVGHFRAVCRQTLRSQNQRGRILRPRI